MTEWIKAIQSLAGIALIGFLVFYLYRKTVSFPLRALYFPALILKLLAGLALGALYFYGYGFGDTVSYHTDAAALSSLAFDHPRSYLDTLLGANREYLIHLRYGIDPRALFFVKILSVVYLLTGQSYWISSLFFSWFSFAGFWFLANFLTTHFRINRATVAVAFFLFPSVVFWTSGILKESVALGAISFLIYYFLQLSLRRKIAISNALLAVAMAWALWQLKYYYAATLGLALIALFLVKWFLPEKVVARQKGLTSALLLVTAVLCAFLFAFLHPNFHPDRFFEVVVYNYETFIAISDPGDVIRYHRLEPTVLSLLLHSPKALVAGLFRPFIWEVNGALQVWVGIENLLILICFGFTLFRLRQVHRNPHHLFIVALILYITILAVLLALSTPNFGTLSRYKTAFLPFLIILITPGAGLFIKKLRRLKKRFFA